MKPARYRLENLATVLMRGSDKQERISILVSERATPQHIRDIDTQIEAAGHSIHYKEYFDIKCWANIGYDLGMVFDSVPKLSDIVIIMYANGSCTIAYRSLYRYGV